MCSPCFIRKVSTDDASFCFVTGCGADAVDLVIPGPAVITQLVLASQAQRQKGRYPRRIRCSNLWVTEFGLL